MGREGLRGSHNDVEELRRSGNDRRSFWQRGSTAISAPIFNKLMISRLERGCVLP
jgi:hypothetical protein